MAGNVLDEPSREELVKAIQAASAAHHEFEANVLHGERDEQWAGWYAAYMLGRLGDFVSASTLTEWVSTAPDSDEWSSTAASHIESQRTL